MIYTNEIIKMKLEKRNKTKKILKFIYIPVIILVLLGCSSILYQKFIEKEQHINVFGYRLFVVLTGSMEPAIKTGDVVVIKDANSNELQVGDIITYSLKNTNQTVTHRIQEVVKKDGKIYYKTKGDNNNGSDTELIPYENIVGKVNFKINQIGIILNALQTTGGIAFVVLIILISWSYSSRKNDRIIAREEARKKYNICKYKEDANDTI